LSDGELFLGFWTSGLEFGDGFGLFFSEIVGLLSAERFAVVRFMGGKGHKLVDWMDFWLKWLKSRKLLKSSKKVVF